jgi:CYTH domain-containing protein
MALEIERKFLVVDDSWRNSVKGSVPIRDGFIVSDKGRKVRVGICDRSATITIKGQRVGNARSEFEYPIPLSDAKELLQMCESQRHLEKRRYSVPAEGVDWQIDVYQGLLKGLVLAEIEMKTGNQTINIPCWVGREVTGDPEYKKVNIIAERLKLVSNAV